MEGVGSEGWSVEGSGAQKSAKSGAPSPLAAKAAVSGDLPLFSCMYSRATLATILRWKPSGSGVPFESQRLWKRGRGSEAARAARRQSGSNRTEWARERECVGARGAE